MLHREVEEHATGSASSIVLLIMRRLSQVFSCEICKILKNHLFYRTPQVATFETEQIHTSAANLLHIRIEILIGANAKMKCEKQIAFIIERWMQCLLLQLKTCRHKASILSCSFYVVLHPDVFWYHLNSMGTQKNS